MSFVLRLCALVFGLLAICVAVLHYSGPHSRFECNFFKLHCPVPKSVTKQTPPDTKYDFSAVGDSMQHWVAIGDDTGSQLSIFVDNREEYNFYTGDAYRYPDFNAESVLSIYSSTKTITSFLLALAVDQQWIHSYDDRVIDYWPEFPTAQRIAAVKNGTVVFKPLTTTTKKESGKRFVTIADVLRHEAGLCAFFDDSHIFWSNASTNEEREPATTYAMMRARIERQVLTYWAKDSDAFPDEVAVMAGAFAADDGLDYYTMCYHMVSRGYILNEIFHRIEPGRRYMSQFMEEEMYPLLSHEDDHFRMHIKGVGLDADADADAVADAEAHNVYAIDTASDFWSLWHLMVPMKVTRTTMHDSSPDICRRTLAAAGVSADAIRNGNGCVQPSIAFMDNFMIPLNPVSVYFRNLPEFATTVKPHEMSRAFEKTLAMECMSCSGMTNAHSIAKLESYLLYQKKEKEKEDRHKYVLSAETAKLMFSEAIPRLDSMLMGNYSAFTMGGLSRSVVNGVEWFGWGGWGGSRVQIAPKYKCVMAYVPKGFFRVTYVQWYEPRVSVILNLISQELKDKQ